MARLSKLSYQLRIYYLAGWSLRRWAVTLALGAAALLALQWVFRGRPPTPWWHWLLPAGFVLGAAALWALGKWAAAHSYVKFAVEPNSVAPAPATLDPNDKVRVWATGRFAVEERAEIFADLLAYWRTFASREHAVMAVMPDSRYLGLGSLPAEFIGMWYIFIAPDAVQEIAPGDLSFGADEGPALRIRYTRLEPNSNEKKPPRKIDETAYLRFEDDATRRLVWADLLA